MSSGVIDGSDGKLASLHDASWHHGDFSGMHALRCCLVPMRDQHPSVHCWDGAIRVVLDGVIMITMVIECRYGEKII